jgi:plastocyanin domain-containing protein
MELILTRLKYGTSLAVIAVISLLSACTTSGAKLPVSEGTASIGNDNTQSIDLRVESFFFKPGRIVVYADLPVRLTLKSGAFIIPHNFTLYAPEAGIDINQNIGHGKTVVVTFTPTKPGEYPFSCGKDHHAQKGMTGTLVVKARE